MNSDFNNFFHIKKSDIVLFIMNFLKSENLNKSLISLEQETNLSLFTYNQELLFLRKLILEGQWQESEDFLNPLKQNQNFSYKLALFEIKKEKFLEAVETEPDPNNNNKDVEILVKQLKEIQKLCPQEEFEKLLKCLSNTPSITDQEEYKNWNPISGRLKCFNIIRKYLEVIYPIQQSEIINDDDLMINVLKSVFFLTTAGNNKIGNSNVKLNDILKNFVKEVDKDIKDNNFQINIVVDGDLITDNKNITDQNSLLKSTRNEMIVSQSQNNFPKEKYLHQEQKNTNKTTSNNNSNNNKVQNFNYNNSNNNNKNIVNNNTIINNNNNNNIINNMNNININTNNNNNPNFNYNYNDITPNEYSISKDQDKSNLSNNNITTNNIMEDYSLIGNGYKIYSKYEISSFSLSKIILDSHPIRTSCFSPKGDYFSIGTNSKSIKIFSLNNILQNFRSYKKITKETSLPKLFEQKNHHLGSIYCLDWSVSGRLLASGSNDKMVKLMVVPELENPNNSMEEEEDILELPIIGHKGTVRSVSFDPSSDLVLLSAGTIDKNIKIWDTENGESKGELIGHLGDIHTLKWSNDGNFFASSGTDKTIRFWDLKYLKSINVIEAFKFSEINDIGLLNRNNDLIIAAGHIDGKITIWNYLNKKLIKEIKENNDKMEIRSVSFSPDGKFLLSSSFDHKIKLFDVNNDFNLLGTLEHEDKVVSAKWHPDIPIIISTSADKSARVWIPQNY